MASSSEPSMLAVLRVLKRWSWCEAKECVCCDRGCACVTRVAGSRLGIASPPPLPSHRFNMAWPEPPLPRSIFGWDPKDEFAVIVADWIWQQAGAHKNVEVSRLRAHPSHRSASHPHALRVCYATLRKERLTLLDTAALDRLRLSWAHSLTRRRARG